MNQETYEILDEVFFSDPITGTYDGILGRLELVDKWQVPPEYVLSEYLDNVLRLPDEFETLEYYMSSVIQELEIKMTDNTIAGLRQLDIELTDKTQRNGARMEELDKKTKDNVLLLQSRIEANLNKIDTNAKDVTSYVDTQIDALDAKMQKHVAAEIAKLGGNGQSDEARRRLAAAHRRARPSRAPVLDRLPDALTLPRRQASNGDSNEENKENGNSENGNSENGLPGSTEAMPCNPRKDATCCSTPRAPPPRPPRLPARPPARPRRLRSVRARAQRTPTSARTSCS